MPQIPQNRLEALMYPVREDVLLGLKGDFEKLLPADQRGGVTFAPITFSGGGVPRHSSRQAGRWNNYKDRHKYYEWTAVSHAYPFITRDLMLLVIALQVDDTIFTLADSSELEDYFIKNRQNREQRFEEVCTSISKLLESVVQRDHIHIRVEVKNMLEKDIKVNGEFPYVSPSSDLLLAEVKMLWADQKARIHNMLFSSIENYTVATNRRHWYHRFINRAKYQVPVESPWIRLMRDPSHNYRLLFIPQNTSENLYDVHGSPLVLAFLFHMKDIDISYEPKEYIYQILDTFHKIDLTTYHQDNQRLMRDKVDAEITNYQTQLESMFDSIGVTGQSDKKTDFGKLQRRLRACELAFLQIFRHLPYFRFAFSDGVKDAGKIKNDPYMNYLTTESLSVFVGDHGAERGRYPSWIGQYHFDRISREYGCTLAYAPALDAYKESSKDGK